MRRREPSRVEEPSRPDPTRSNALSPPAAALSPATVIALQRSAGNRAVGALLTPGRPLLQRLKPGEDLPAQQEIIDKRVRDETRPTGPSTIAAVQQRVANRELFAEAADALKVKHLDVPDDLARAAERVLTKAFAAATDWDRASMTAT